MEIYQVAIKNTEKFTCPHGLRCGPKNYSPFNAKNKHKLIQVKEENSKSASKDEKVIL